MGNDMLNKPATRPISARILNQLSDFKRDERGAIAIFVLLLFFVMMLFGGIAVDVARFEMRRVTLQETMDRAVLAAASLTQPDDVSPKVTAEDWWTKAGLGDELQFEYATPTVSAFVDPSQRRVSAKSKVRSYNYFMGMMDIPFLEGPAASEAAQGVNQIEVMLVLDITGSMGRPAVTGSSKSKMEALRESATEFVTLVKETDVKNGVSIGMVPYAAQVNIPQNLREQFNVTNVSSWDFVANQGVPMINCIEVPTSTYSTMELSTSLSMRMAAVADLSTKVVNTGEYRAPSTYPVSVDQSDRLCTTKNDDPGTPEREDEYNHVLLPTKDGAKVTDRISQLTADGNTSIAIGMRWGTALMDQGARPIYNAIVVPDEAGMAGRPVDNDDPLTRKIIILMTDGSHVTNKHVKDTYKSGPSPIWIGSDGNFAIRFWSGGGALNNGTRPGLTSPNFCSGWNIGTTREFFVPHLKWNSLKKKFAATDPEGVSTGTTSAVSNACDPRSWVAGSPVAAPTELKWPEYDMATGLPKKDSSGNIIMVSAQQLDWSEVWRYLRVDYVARQVYMRSGVTGATNFDTLMNAFRKTYLTDAATLDGLLQTNCTAAKAAGVEIYGIAFAAPAEGQTQIKNCSSPDQDSQKYYYDATNNEDLTAAFRAIATDITDLRLTQ
jgi:Putative Flp pilus-assembly TadE/G-like